jgi:energy-coupling factor transporter ATP-binding protein EcfA2
MTTSAMLKSLTLTAFRGSAGTFSLSFEKGKKLTLIYGENGTGKTTICDAFEFLAKDNIGSLDNRGLGTSVRKYWRTVGKDPQDFAVELTTSDGTCTGKLAGNLKTVLSGVAPKIELLRQRKIIDLMEAQPAKRYETIKRFIDIDAFERSEEALRQQGKALVTELASAKQAEAQSLEELQSSYVAAGSPPGLNAVEWAKQKLAEPTTGLEADITAISKLRSAYDVLKAFPENLDGKHSILETAQANADAADQAQIDALATVDSEAAERATVLTAGKAYLETYPHAEQCPLCESKENIATLASTVQSTLSQLSALTSANHKKKQAQTALSTAKTALQQAEADYAKALKVFSDARAAYQWKAGVQLPASAVPSDASALPAWLADNETVAASWAENEASWRGESKFRAQLKDAADRYDANAERVVELSALIPRLDQALAECVEERQKFTDGIISAIAKEVGKLYEKVHPKEGLDKIALELDPNQRASLKLGATFEGHDAPPQAYFSQSHLDTLGLCVFLALAARDGASETVLILDDVLGSIDEPHVERVIDMIYEVSADFRHTILTTHYRPWREKYRWGWLKPGQPCQFVELTGWAIDDGIRIVTSLPEVELLRTRLAESPTDIQSICSKAGVILEAALDYLTQKYACAVPRRRDQDYTIGDLLPAIKGSLRDALRVEMRDGITDPAAPSTSTVALKPILDELMRIAQVRNAFGAHFKTLSFELLDTDGIGFAKQVLELADTLVCPDHGWPSNNNSGSYWRNSGDTRRLHPLIKPA